MSLQEINSVTVTIVLLQKHNYRITITHVKITFRQLLIVVILEQICLNLVLWQNINSQVTLYNSTEVSCIMKHFVLQDAVNSGYNILHKHPVKAFAVCIYNYSTFCALKCFDQTVHNDHNIS